MCAFVAPSAAPWIEALAIHIGLNLLCGVPLGVLLFSASKSARRALGVLVAVGAATGTQLVVSYGRDRFDLTWVGAFLVATFGLTVFFKSLEAAFATHPDGADASLSTWLLYYVSLPEPSFAKGKPARAPPGAVGHRLSLILVKVLGTSALFSVLVAYPRHAPFDGAGWAGYLGNGYLHMWAAYFLLALLTDIGTLLTNLGGHAAEPAFDNPMLAGRSFADVWGARWNLSVRPLPEAARPPRGRPAVRSVRSHRPQPPSVPPPRRCTPS